MKRKPEVFLDTSVIIAAVLSPTGGARKLFLLAEAGLINLVVGSIVLRECETVVRRKVPASLPILAHLLELGRVEIANRLSADFIALALEVVNYEPDAYVFAEALSVAPDWFVTHDKAHFLKGMPDSSFDFQIGTPGDFIQELEDQYRLL
jgi:predicted nucleic acid-binding protein